VWGLGLRLPLPLDLRVQGARRQQHVATTLDSGNLWSLRAISHGA